MLERAIAGLLARYFFEDGMIQKIGLFLQRGDLEIYASTPILPAHAGYSQARVDKNYRQGRIYSQEDWCDLKILLGAVENCDARIGLSILADEQVHEMPYEFEIDRFEIGVLSESVGSLLLEAEALSLSCRFQLLKYSDSPMKPV